MKIIEKNIENKLILDAQAFKKNPPEIMHNNIMRKIENSNSVDQKMRLSNLFNWFLPTGIAAATLILIAINFTPKTDIKYPVIQSINNQNVIQLSKLNINELSKSLEYNITSVIQAEKKALQADLIYMKSIFAL